MGLDTSHDCWHGAYGAFSRWRNQIAMAAGYAVWECNFGDWTSPTIMLDWGHISPENLAGEWEADPSDPLVVLFAHSDCEGQIHARHAGPLADALERLMPRLPGLEFPGHIGNMADKTQRFIDGLRRASAAGEHVVFS